ncbi:MAG: STM3941 family protein [Gemmatimonadales bacterium]
MERLVARANRSHTAAKIAFGAALVAAGFALLRTGAPAALGWTVLVLGLVMGALFLRALSDDDEVFVLDGRGVTCRSLPIGTVPWSDVRDAQLQTISRTRVVALDLVDVESYLLRLPLARRHIARKTLEAGLPPSCLPITGTDADPDQVLAAIRAHLGQ